MIYADSYLVSFVDCTIALRICNAVAHRHALRHCMGIIRVAHLVHSNPHCGKRKVEAL